MLTIRERITSCGTLRCLPSDIHVISARTVAYQTLSIRPPEQYIPPVQEPYAYIIFRASEVKDLSVDEPQQQPPARRNVHDDPAVLGVSDQPFVISMKRMELRPEVYESKTYQFESSTHRVDNARCVSSASFLQA